jgi:hypothetical protein
MQYIALCMSTFDKRVKTKNKCDADHVIVEATSPETKENFRISPDPHRVAKVCVCYAHLMVGLDIGDVLQEGHNKNMNSFSLLNKVFLRNGTGISILST